MTEEIRRYIQAARDKELSDEQIIEQLVAAGWTESQARAALLPSPPPPPQAGASGLASIPSQPAKSKGMPTLQTALLHSLLWLFTFSTSIVLGVVAATIFGGDATVEALASYIAVVLVTITPYAFFYLYFLKAVKKDAQVTAGKVWSTLTVVFHAIGAIGASITLVISIITNPTLSLIVAAASIAILDLIVLTTFVFATFVKPTHALRNVVLRTSLPMLGIFLGFFGVLAVIQLGPLKADQQTREQLVSAVRAIREYTESNDALPNSLGDTNVKEDMSGVTYAKTTETQYKLCADFRTEDDQGFYDSDDGVYGDARVDGYVFMPGGKGERCFELKSDHLEERTKQQEWPRIEYYR